MFEWALSLNPVIKIDFNITNYFTPPNTLTFFKKKFFSFCFAISEKSLTFAVEKTKA